MHFMRLYNPLTKHNKTFSILSPHCHWNINLLICVSNRTQLGPEYCFCTVHVINKNSVVQMFCCRGSWNFRNREAQSLLSVAKSVLGYNLFIIILVSVIILQSSSSPNKFTVKGTLQCCIFSHFLEMPKAKDKAIN